MDATAEYKEEATSQHGESYSSSSMLEPALLLKQCGTADRNTKELISFIEDTDKETGEITTLKIVL